MFDVELRGLGLVFARGHDFGRCRADGKAGVSEEETQHFQSRLRLVNFGTDATWLGSGFLAIWVCSTSDNWQRRGRERARGKCQMATTFLAFWL